MLTFGQRDYEVPGWDGAGGGWGGCRGSENLSGLVFPWKVQQSARQTLGKGEAASGSVHPEDQAVIKGVHGEEGPPLLEVHCE